MEENGGRPLVATAVHPFRNRARGVGGFRCERRLSVPTKQRRNPSPLLPPAPAPSAQTRPATPVLRCGGAVLRIHEGHHRHRQGVPGDRQTDPPARARQCRLYRCNATTSTTTTTTTTATTTFIIAAVEAVFCFRHQFRECGRKHRHGCCRGVGGTGQRRGGRESCWCRRAGVGRGGAAVAVGGEGQRGGGRPQERREG